MQMYNLDMHAGTREGNISSQFIPRNSDVIF